MKKKSYLMPVMKEVQSRLRMGLLAGSVIADGVPTNSGNGVNVTIKIPGYKPPRKESAADFPASVD